MPGSLANVFGYEVIPERAANDHLLEDCPDRHTPHDDVVKRHQWRRQANTCISPTVVGKIQYHNDVKQVEDNVNQLVGKEELPGIFMKVEA